MKTLSRKLLPFADISDSKLSPLIGSELRDVDHRDAGLRDNTRNVDVELCDDERNVVVELRDDDRLDLFFLSTLSGFRDFLSILRVNQIF